MSIHASAELPTPYAALAPEPASLALEPDTICALREEIDAIDAAIARLVLVRSQLSHRIQATRRSAGGPRVLLSRERAIREHYRAVIGADGTVIADAVLRVCRGD